MEPIDILILDYLRPKEGILLLKSLKQHIKFNSNIIYLVNGAEKPEEYEYAFDFYRQGLIDKLLINKKGNGAGFGHCDLLRYSSSKYFIFIQVDQFLTQDILPETVDFFIDLLENKNFKLVDLAGDQSNKGIYSDRAHFGERKFFLDLELEKNAGGGPGPFQSSKRWNENYIQEVFSDREYKIAHISPLFFADNGKVSIREVNGGRFLHYTDEKTLFVLEIPKEKDNWYNLTDSEWEEVLTGKWPKEGKVPLNFQSSSFKYWH